MIILFVFRKSQNKRHKGIIYARITLGNERPKQLSTGVKCEKKDWNAGRQSIKNDEFANKDLERVKYALIKSKQQLEYQEKPFGLSDVINLFLAPNQKPKEELKEKSICEILKELISKKQAEKTIKKPTYSRYEWQIAKIKDFFCQQQTPDLSYKDFNYTLFEALISYLRTADFGRGKNKKNTYLKRYKQILQAGNQYAIKKGYTKNVLQNFDTFKDDSDETPFLSPEQLDIIENKNLSNDPVMEVVRDIFVLQCHTGMLPSDLLSFDKNKHLEGEWINKNRDKTKNLAQIRISKKAKEILEKYEYQPHKVMFENQTHNRILKQLALICGIDVPLTNRVGRKTAGMVWLNAGVRIETVSAMLGHKDIRITQKHYAKMLKDTIKKDTDILCKQ